MKFRGPRSFGGKPALMAIFSLLWAGFLLGSQTGIFPQTVGFSDSAWAAPRGLAAYTPPPGSPERRDIVEGLRRKLRDLHRIEAVFEVRYLKVSQGWAWISANPRSPDGSRHYEGVAALLRQEGGSWQVVEFPCIEEDNPDCLGQPGYFKKLKARFPQAPPDIFPE